MKAHAGRRTVGTAGLCKCNIRAQLSPRQSLHVLPKRTYQQQCCTAANLAFFHNPSSGQRQHSPAAMTAPFECHSIQMYCRSIQMYMNSLCDSAFSAPRRSSTSCAALSLRASYFASSVGNSSRHMGQLLLSAAGGNCR